MRDGSKAPSYRWVIVSTLSVTETISWGILYYAFGILLAPMEREMGWSRAQSTAAFSIALLVSAVFAVPAGRQVDRGGARLMMTLGSCAGVALLVAWARVESLPALYLIWAAVGVTMAAWATALPERGPTLWQRLLGRPASESGRLCHGAGGPEGGRRCRRAFMLTILLREGGDRERLAVRARNHRQVRRGSGPRALP
jgi:MFS family permease